MHYIYWALVPLLTYLLSYLLYLITQLLRGYKTGNRGPISETVEDRAKLLLTAYIKSFTGFRLPPKLLYDREWPLSEIQGH